ncbi:MAG: hypothetical protein KIT31_40650, partial [Deltaproteobacteria bacterium]|nr:hypothetical protein [Deltaproteobacteria bacterium]
MWLTGAVGCASPGTWIAPVRGAAVAPATIVAALDDPIIPAGDLDRLPREPRLRIVVTEQGGHCGFIESLGAGSWAERFIHAEFERQLSGDGEPAAGSAPVSTAP